MAFVDEGGGSSAVWAVVGQTSWWCSWLIHNDDGVMHAGRVRCDDLAAGLRVCRCMNNLLLRPPYLSSYLCYCGCILCSDNIIAIN